VAKIDDRRAELIERMADYVLAEGLTASSIRPLAVAANVSDRMLLYYFDDKSDVIVSILEALSKRLIVILERQTSKTRLPLDKLRSKLADTVLDQTVWPYMRLWLEIASKAAQGDATCRVVGERIGRGFLAWGLDQLDSPTPKAREVDAAKLLVAIEGLVLLKSIGMEDVGRKAM
jgi:AcrR family transcriptional regulator